MIETRAEAIAVETEFAVRIDRIRARFVLKLADKIPEIDVALSRMAGNGSDAVDAVASAYRWFHDVSGIGSIIGFDATGRQARLCAAVLINSFRAQRCVSPDELASLTSGFGTFRVVALNETHFTELNQKPVP
jgi:hypothetical protein